jgi:hypothetical protein
MLAAAQADAAEQRHALASAGAAAR